jgi:hypothetical protein
MHSELLDAQWRKSSRSSGGESNCVEVALGPVVGVRDTKDRAAGHLALTPRSWSAFLSKVASREA